jgi:hypothetical protein
LPQRERRRDHGHRDQHFHDTESVVSISDPINQPHSPDEKQNENDEQISDKHSPLNSASIVSQAGPICSINLHDRAFSFRSKSPSIPAE